MGALTRVDGVVRWLAYTAAATAVVLLFTMGGADPAADEAAGDEAAAGADPATLALGADVYASSCAVCHGAAGEGGTGPALVDVADTYPDPAGQRLVVVGGRNGMPGFGGRLADDEIDAVVAFTREGW